jgi:hypothetical protein
MSHKGNPFAGTPFSLPPLNYPGDGLIVELPKREHAKTHAFHVCKRMWEREDKSGPVTLIKIRGMNRHGEVISDVHSGRQDIVIALDDLPLVLAGIRRVLAGPLERLLIEHEAYYSSEDFEPARSGGENGSENS